VVLEVGSSKRKKFRSFLASYTNWQFLEPVADYVDHLDEAYRAPEFHKSSILRAVLLGRKLLDPNAINLFVFQFNKCSGRT
jgi:hypothetical protein